jgi:hypothetical protein
LNFLYTCVASDYLFSSEARSFLDPEQKLVYATERIECAKRMGNVVRLAEALDARIKLYLKGQEFEKIVEDVEMLVFCIDLSSRSSSKRAMYAQRPSIPVPHRMREDVIAGDGFIQGMRGRGWSVADFRPVHSDPQVIRQAWLECPSGARYSELGDGRRATAQDRCLPIFRTDAQKMCR